MAGFQGVFRPKGRKAGTTWYLKFRDTAGTVHVESARTSDYAAAVEILKARIGTIADGAPVEKPKHRITWEEGATTMIHDYINEGRRTVPGLRAVIDQHLTPVFGGRPLAEITTDDLRAYTASKLNPATGVPLARATVRRHLAIVKRVLRLAHAGRRLAALPHVPMINEGNNVRQGFFEPHQFEAVLARLPEWMRLPCEFAYVCGWRFHDEVLSLEWRQVNREHRTVLLAAGDTKTGSARHLPYGSHPRLVAVFEAAWQRHTAHLAEGRIGTHVFTDDAGAPVARRTVHGHAYPLRAVREAWTRATTEAGVPGRFLHDFRRTAARNLIRSGVPEAQAMRILGHETASIFRRYAIVDDRDLANALGRLAEAPSSLPRADAR